MKKLYYLIIALISFSLLLSASHAGYNVSSKIKNRIDTVMTVVEKQWWSESTIAQINKYQKIVDSFGRIKFNWEAEEMIWYLWYLFENKIDELQEEIVTQNELISNVDWNKVQDAWVSWHNEERASLWLDPYKINESLNFSSLVWAQNLAELNYSTHARQSSDNWEYNYYSMLDRFNWLWIDFNYKLTAFSENIAYQYYSCNKSDCTSEMIAALKKWYNFFLNEKYKTYKLHYNAIIHPVFDEIGVWVALVGKRYWVVSHYGVNVE